MRQLAILCLALIISLVRVSAVTARANAAGANKYTAHTKDSLKMSVWVTTSPSDSAAPIMMLLPMMAHTHESYDPLIEAVSSYQAGDSSTEPARALPHFVAFDLRGHGESTIRGSDTLSFRGMSVSEFAKYPSDVEGTLENVWDQVQRDESGFLVVGASIGANTAMMITETMPVISKVVLLSPGEDYRGLQPAGALKKFTGKILIFACEDDKYSAASSRKLAALNAEHCTLHIFKGSTHGTDIVNNNPEAMQILVEWLCAP